MSQPNDKIDHATCRIRELNDALRTEFAGGSWKLTLGLYGLGAPTVLAAVRAIQAFADFTPDNDPYGEHDFGAIEVNGHRIFWKIDYFDMALEYGSPDPADATVTRRILTVMRAEEY